MLCGPAVVSGDDVSPMEKVVTVLGDLQIHVVMEWKAEAKNYDKLTCVCKDVPEKKTWGIKTRGHVHGPHGNHQ